MSNLFKVACLALLFCAPVTAKPKPPPAFMLVGEKDGDSECEIDPDGLCIMSHKGKGYKPDTMCNFNVLRDVKLDVDYFDLGLNDRLRVANVPFRGTDGPQDVFVELGSRIQFIAQEVPGASSSDDTKKGWKICASDAPPNPVISGPTSAGQDAACLTYYTSRGVCILSDPWEMYDYGKSHRCTWRVHADVKVYSHVFRLGESDRLRVNNVPYRNDNGPNGVTAEAGSLLRFLVKEREITPEYLESDIGFRVCTFPPGDCTEECCEDADCGDTTAYKCNSQNQCELKKCEVGGSVECCNNGDCRPSSSFVCEETKCINKGNPRFTLTWFGDDDLDLYVITPQGDQIYFENPIDTTSGGELDRDFIPSQDTPGEQARWVENVNFPRDGTAPQGIYTYFVNQYDRIGAADDWTLAVYEGDTLVALATGGGLSTGEDSTYYIYDK